MKWWKKFWKLRKQNDVIKAALVFFAISMGFLADDIYNGIGLYQMMQHSTEYVLTEESGRLITDARLENIQKLENVMALSREQDIPVTLQYRSNKVTISCTALSETYINAVYGIKEFGAMKTFYMNKAAFKLLRQGLNDAQALEMDKKQGMLSVNYFMENQEKNDIVGQDGDASMVLGKRAAKIILIKNNMSDSPYVFCSSNHFELSKNASFIRVSVSNQKPNNETVQKLQALGFIITNTETVLETEYTQKIKADRIGHGIATSLICLACAATLWKYGMHSHEPSIR